LPELAPPAPSASTPVETALVEGVETVKVADNDTHRDWWRRQLQLLPGHETVVWRQRDVGENGVGAGASDLASAKWVIW
jgi:hypothetical protein